MAGLKFLAFDLGAESGRAVLGSLGDERLSLTEIHRFANEPLLLPERCGECRLVCTCDPRIAEFADRRSALRECHGPPRA